MVQENLAKFFGIELLLLKDQGQWFFEAPLTTLASQLVEHSPETTDRRFSTEIRYRGERTHWGSSSVSVDLLKPGQQWPNNSVCVCHDGTASLMKRFHFQCIFFLVS